MFGHDKRMILRIHYLNKNETEELYLTINVIIYHNTTVYLSF